LAEKIPAQMAATLARAVVDPTDARRRLERLTQIRVPGGIVYALETTVWATAAVPYVVNNREASARHFPAGVNIGSAEAARYRPLRPPVDAPDGSARLKITATEPQHLVWSLDRSAKFLIENNDLTESVGLQGVLQHVTLAVVEVDFQNDDGPVTMLGSIDGSSRVNSAHAVLGVTPHQAVFGYPRNERVHRQFISGLLENLERPATAVADDDVKRLRALELPARIFVKFEPDAVTPVSFSKAVDSFVHLVHVEPPKPWDEAASRDAKADSVLNELESQGQITRKKKSYYEGMLTPAEARASKLPVHLDERAVELVALISNDKAGIYRAVREGILLLSKRGNYVKKEAKAEIAVELALRGIRAGLKKADAQGARETLQNSYLHPDIWGKRVRPASGTPEELRDDALQELEDGEPGVACVRIAAQGAYWLGTQRILREARFFDEASKRDGRTPQRVLGDLMGSHWGINVLHRAIVDGRDGIPIVQVDENGTRQKGVNGKILEANHAWLRGQVVPQKTAGPLTAEPGGGGSSVDGGPALPDRQLLTKLGELKKAVEHLEDRHDAMREVKDASGKILVVEEGIAYETAEDLRRRLEELRTQLAMYGFTWKLKNAQADVDPGLEHEDADGSQAGP
ncbi:MAG: hypothetical protein JWM93_1297, partial [Frankiales bacterium]|nr:hypothetical protein [Frankiales bacterium]